MRFSTRRNVDFPQPDGPISAQTEFSGIVSVILNSACVRLYQNDRSRTANFGRTPERSGDPRPAVLRSDMIAVYGKVDTAASPTPGRQAVPSVAGAIFSFRA